MSEDVRPRSLLVIRQAPREVPRDPLPPRPRPRPWRQVATTIALMLIVLASGLYVNTTPLGNVVLAQAASGDIDLALQTLANPSIAHEPTGPWDTSAGVASELGEGGGAGPGVVAPGSAGLPVAVTPPDATTVPTVAATVTPAPALPATVTPRPHPTATPQSTSVSSSPSSVSPTPRDLAQWASPTGYRSFKVASANRFYWWAFGQCTWWAQHERRDENLTRMGNAQFWATGAKRRGYKVGSTPRVGSTVVFQPGVQGAGGAGHVAHVLKVYASGWFLVSEMNFYWNGGGFGSVDFRYVHVGVGVSFIY